MLEKDAKSNGYPGADGKPKGQSERFHAEQFREFAKFVSTYTAEKCEQALRRAGEATEDLAKIYADPKVKVMSLWTMGFNQHTRGTWANNMVYNIHLLTGKISQPGNSPFSPPANPAPAARRARSARCASFAGGHGGDQSGASQTHRRNLATAARHAERQDWANRGGASPRIGRRKLKIAIDLDHQQHAGRPNINGEILPGWRNPKPSSW